MKLTMPASQWSQFDFCNYVIICSINLEMRDEAIFGFIMCLGHHAENTNRDKKNHFGTIAKLALSASLWS